MSEEATVAVDDEATEDEEKETENKVKTVLT